MEGESVNNGPRLSISYNILSARKIEQSMAGAAKCKENTGSPSNPQWEECAESCRRALSR